MVLSNQHSAEHALRAMVCHDEQYVVSPKNHVPLKQQKSSIAFFESDLKVAGLASCDVHVQHA